MESTNNQHHQIVLYSSPISDCCARLRIALDLKGLQYQTISVSLRDHEQTREDYVSVNPARTVPTIVIRDTAAEQTPVVLSQSIAALEYLEEAFPSTRQLLPPFSQPDKRAKVRTLMGIIATDIHPLTTHRVGLEMSKRFSDTKSQGVDDPYGWDIYWITKGLAAYEMVCKEITGIYSVGDDITLADVCLLPQIWTAVRLDIDIGQYPTILGIYKALSLVPQILSTKQDPSSELD